MSNKEKKPFVPVVAVLNMKGGVGKTTITANLSRIIFENYKKSTLLLDLDPQFNLTQTLFKAAAYDKFVAEKKTIAEVFSPTQDLKLFEISTNKIAPPDPKSITNTFWHFKGSNPFISLDVVPGSFSLVKYNLMSDHAQLEAAQDRFSSFIEISKNNYDIVGIDCNPSSSFLTICALKACSHILVPVRPDKYSVLGLDMLWQFVHDILPINPKPQFVILLNGVPRSKNADVANVVAELRAHPIYGPLTLANVMHESSILRARTDFTGFATDRRVSRSKRLKLEMSNLSGEIVPRIGLKAP